MGTTTMYIGCQRSMLIGLLHNLPLPSCNSPLSCVASLIITGRVTGSIATCILPVVNGTVTMIEVSLQTAMITHVVLWAKCS